MPVGGGNITYPSSTVIVLYWDTNGSSPGGSNSTTGVGTWGTNLYWTNDFNGLTATKAWVQGSDAIFSAGNNVTGAYTVTVSGVQNVHNLIIKNGTLTFSSGTLQVTAGAIWRNLTSNTTIITSAIQATNRLTLTTGIFSCTSVSGSGAGGWTINGATLFTGSANTIGTGTLILNAGKLSATSNSAISFTNNDLLITGSFTVGDLVNTGSLSFGTNQSITSPVSITALSNVSFNSSMTWGANVLTIKGSGTITQNSTIAAATNSGNINVGDGTTFSGNGVGGILSAPVLSAMGSGSYIVNYGGVLNFSCPNFVISNNITINAGGKVGFRGTQGSGGASWIINSFAELTNLVSGDFIGVVNVTLPSAGVLFGSPANTLSLGRTYPSLTGTMVFGGSAAGVITSTSSAVVLSSVTNSSRTIAFNTIGGGGFNFTTGLTLNADCTIAGNGVGGLYGFVPNSLPSSTLNSVTQDANRDINLKMGSIGMVEISTASSGWRNTFINGGTLQLRNANGVVGSGIITLDGGTLRQFNTNSGSTLSISNNITVKARGGAIEFVYSNARGSTGNVSITGSIANDVSGVGPIILRVNCITGVAAYLGITGNNVGFDGGFVLSDVCAVISTAVTGPIQFGSSVGTGVSALGSDGSGISGNTFNKNSIIVPDGVAFGFRNNCANSTANLKAAFGSSSGYFTTSSNSILCLENINTRDINLSNSGTDFLNRDIRIGNGSASIVYSGVITPYANTYKFTPTSLTGLILSATNRLSGSNNLDVAAGAVVPGALNPQFGNLIIQNSQSLSGAVTITGTIKNSLMGGSVQGSNIYITNNGVTSQGDLPNITSISLTRGAGMYIVGTAANYGRITASNLPISVMGAAVFNDGETIPNNEASNNNITNRIAPTATLIIGGSDGGGTFNIPFPAVGAFTHSQTLASLTIRAGLSTISYSNVKASTINLIFTGTVGGAGYLRLVGGFLNSITTTGFNISYTNTPSSAGGSTVSGSGGNAILIGLGINFVSGTDAGDYISAISGVWTAASYTIQNNCSLWVAGQNIKAGVTTGTISNDLAINSFRITGGVGTVTIAAGKTLTISSGMICSTTNGSQIFTGGFITTGNGVDLIIGSQQNQIILRSQITGNFALTKILNNILSLSNSSNQISDIYVLAGTISVSASGALGDITASRTIYLMGGNIQFNHSFVTYTNTNIVVSPVGGGFVQSATSGAGAKIQGAITLNGSLTFASLGAGNGRMEFAGDIIGAGDIRIPANYGQSGDYCLFILSGNNSAWSGGIFANESTGQAGSLNIQLAKGTSAGTGPIVVASKGFNLYLDTNTSSDSIYPNDLQINFPINLILWSLGPGLGTGAGTSATLTGRLVGTSNLIFYGYATGDTSISEVVLAGPVALAGPPASPFASSPGQISQNFGTSTNYQNFVNGQGGISLGGTPISYAVALPVGSANQGALGFIRFANLQSFIPGAVGPGYIAAIHRASDTVDRTGHFGFLLTATSGVGTTYQLPQGKSFLIGSLGLPDPTLNKQIGGTLGASSTSGLGNNIAILQGQVKHSLGETLAGMSGGDINIYANTAIDTQVLKLLVRYSGDTLTLGDTLNPVTFCPTWGDSGGQSVITLMRKRTGNTTLIKVGIGTLNIANTRCVHTDGSDATSSFIWQVTTGTLNYSQIDSGADYAGFTIQNGATLSGSGTINSIVSIVSGTINPGNTGTAILTTKSLIFNNSSATAIFHLNGTTVGTQYDQIVIPLGGNLTLNSATLSIILGYAATPGTVFTIVNNQSGSISGIFNGLPEGSIIASTGIIQNFIISYVNAGSNVTLTAL